MPGADVEVEVFTLEKAAAEYLAAHTKKLEHRDRVAVARFVSWCGTSRLLGEITAHEMTLFQEAQGENVADLPERLLPIKAFLAHAKRRNWELHEPWGSSAREEAGRQASGDNGHRGRRQRILVRTLWR